MELGSLIKMELGSAISGFTLSYGYPMDMRIQLQIFFVSFHLADLALTSSLGSKWAVLVRGTPHSLLLPPPFLSCRPRLPPLYSLSSLPKLFCCLTKITFQLTSCLLFPISFILFMKKTWAHDPAVEQSNSLPPK